MQNQSQIIFSKLLFSNICFGDILVRRAQEINRFCFLNDTKIGREEGNVISVTVT